MVILFVSMRFIPGHGWGLFPTNAGSAQHMDEKIPKEKELRADVTQPRNLAHHKKYWALCAVVAEAMDITSEEVSDILKIRTGHFERLKLPEFDFEIARPKSIAFHSMNQLIFNEFFERCIRVIYEHWYGKTGDSRRDLYLKQRLNEMLAPSTAEKRG